MKWPYTTSQQSKYHNKSLRQSAKKEIDFGLQIYDEENGGLIWNEFDYEAYEDAVIGWFETGYIDPRYLNATQ
jgi:hypothetical protein